MKVAEPGPPKPEAMTPVEHAILPFRLFAKHVRREEKVQVIVLLLVFANTLASIGLLVIELLRK